MGKLRKALFLLAVAGVPAMLLAPAAQAQEQPKTSAKSKAASQSGPSLLDVTRVSTDQAVKAAVHDQLNKRAGTQSSSAAESNAVLEFHPAPVTSQSNDDPFLLKQDGSKKSPLKDVHGEIYGESGHGGVNASRVGGDVGAKTKSGKTYIFLQTGQTKVNPSTPH